MANRTDATKIIGVTGLSIWGGQVGEEYLSALANSRKTKIYIEMQDDVVIGSLLDSMIMPLVAADFSTVPATDMPADKAAAGFLDECMHDMTDYSWRQHVIDMLSMLAWGWSCSEIVLKKRLGANNVPQLDGTVNAPSQFVDGRIGIDILDPRGQETLFKWEMDPNRKGDVLAMHQRDPMTGVVYRLEKWKLVHTTFRSKKRSPEGTSPLRSLYRAWYTRKNLEIIEAIGSERDLAGLPVCYLPVGATDADRDKAETIVRNLRNDEEAGLVIPAPPLGGDPNQGWRIELLSSSGSKQYNVREVIRDLNKLILMRFFANFLLLGMDSVGTQALVKGSQDFFSLALKSVQAELIESWNNQLVPLLFKYNTFPGMTALPKIDWAEPGKNDVASAANLLSQLVGVNIITPDPGLEDWMRKMSGLPDRPPGVGAIPRQPVPPLPAPLRGALTYDWQLQKDGSWVVRKKPAKYEADLGGAMLAIAVPADVASQIVVPGGEPADLLHITLAFLGDCCDIQESDRQCIQELVASVIQEMQPIHVALEGTGTFPVGKDGKTPFFARVQSPELKAMREQICAALDEAGVDYSKDFKEFKPHVTLKYLEPGEKEPSVALQQSFEVDRVHAVFGGVWAAVPMAVTGEFAGTSEGAVKGWGKYPHGGGSVGANKLNDTEKTTAHEALNKLKQFPDEGRAGLQVIKARDVLPNPEKVKVLSVTKTETQMAKYMTPENVAVKDIIIGQMTIPVDGIKAYIDNPPDKLPEIARTREGKMYVFAGHTRIAAQALAGRETIKANVFNYDEEIQDVVKHFAQAAGTTGRRLPGRIEKATNDYQALLVSTYDEWRGMAANALEKALKQGIGDDEVKSILDEKLMGLSDRLKELGRANLNAAVRMGYGAELSPEALVMVADRVRENEKYIDESLIPRMREKIVDFLFGRAAFALGIDLTALEGAFAALRIDVAQYAGPFYSAIFIGAGLTRKEQDHERAAQGEKPRRVRWVLDSNANHCKARPGYYGCPDLEGEYESWAALPSVPAGRVACLINCRCGILVENDQGGWDRVA